MLLNFFEELKTLIETMDTRTIDYAICGGVALAIHGAPRATQDIDVMVRPEDLGRVREAAAACGFTFESLPMELSSGVTIQRFTKLIEQQPFMLDVLLASASLGPIWAGRVRVPFEDRTLSVVSRDGLIALKLAAGRPQDLVDIQRLEEAGRG